MYLGMASFNMQDSEPGWRDREFRSPRIESCEECDALNKTWKRTFDCGNCGCANEIVAKTQ